MSTYRYWTGPGGRRFCYAVEPTYRCPVASMETALDEPAGAAAALLGIGGDELLRILARAHRSEPTRRRVGGRLTDICDTCGHRLTRLGFRVWEERPATEEEKAESSGLRMSERLGFGALVKGKQSWCETKREAMDWCREELRSAKAVAAEEVA